VTDERALARELAAAAVRDGEPTRWFEELYARAERGEAVVPWADARPSPTLARLLPSLQVAGQRVLVVGCGYGDDAVLLAAAGADVTAFDVSATAVEHCRRRFPDVDVTWCVGDALAPAAAWRRGFDLVVEVNTLQVLPPRERAVAGRALGACVAGGGALLVVCRGREPDEPEGTLPWPLTRAEVEALAVDGLSLDRLDDLLDGEEPPVRRFVAVLRRTEAGGGSGR
jgi:SAM-dependent methyltransferase